MTEEQLRKIINSKTWHFAKTMPSIPHYYARRREWGNDFEFEEVMVHMLVNSKAEKFYNKLYFYFYLDGWKYWTMGEKPSQTEIINRAKA